VTLSEIIKDASTDDVIGKMKVSALLESLPGVGKIRAKQIMERLGIAESRRVRGLGANQRAALEQEFGYDSSSAEDEFIGRRKGEAEPSRISGDVPIARELQPSGVEVSPVRIYLSSGDAREAVEVAVAELLDRYGIEIVRTFPGIKGSWYRKLLVSPRTGGPSTDDAMAMISSAIQFQTFSLPKPEVDVRQVDAVAKLVMALDKEENAAIQLGSVLFIKANDNYAVTNLTGRQMDILEKNPELLENPATVLKRLKRALDAGAHSPGKA
jgi:ribosomal protein S13